MSVVGAPVFRSSFRLPFRCQSLELVYHGAHFGCANIVAGAFPRGLSAADLTHRGWVKFVGQICGLFMV